MQRLTIRTSRKREVIDITEKIAAAIRERSSNAEGICHVHVLHTTAALTTADLDPGTDLDMLDAFYAMVPKLKYRHPHNPVHVPDHILSALIGAEVTVPAENGTLVLGTWQRVILIEFDGPRERELVISFVAAE